MDVLIFDLDNTLYPAEKHLFGLIDVRINHYMESQVGIEPGDVDSLRRQYWQDYGTTLQGFQQANEFLQLFFNLVDSLEYAVVLIDFLPAPPARIKPEQQP